MLLTHAIAIAEARSYIAALADHSHTMLGSIAYDRTLIALDAAYGDDVPATITVPVTDAATLYPLAQKAVTDLAEHGLDPLHIELTLAYVADAWALDNGSTKPGRRVLPSWIDLGDPS